MNTIFVSSTFKDMHFERDAIQLVTLPILKEKALEYGENISFCDLRWGINTGDLDTEEGSRKVLEVCLDEIDRSTPPMVVILGDRYGWIPSESLTQSAAERRKMELEDLNISVTALEVAYGALSTPERRERTLFYFRKINKNCPEEYKAEDAEHKEKLKKLKKRIKELAGDRIKEFSVVWDGEKLNGVIPFAKMLAEDIEKILKPQWEKKEKMSPFERERITHWSFIKEKNEMFSARVGLVDQLFGHLTNSGNNFLSIKAPSGSGKSSIFSNLALKLKAEGYSVLPFIGGLTSESNDSLDILRNTVYYIEECLGISHDEKNANKNLHNDAVNNIKSEKDRLRERLNRLCAECEKDNKRIVIMVDAVDQLSADSNRDDLIFIPDRLSDSIKFVMTSLPHIDIIGRESFILSPICDEEKREVISGVLNAHHRQLEKSVIDRMAELKASDNPLYLSLLIQRLMMMNRDDFTAINSKQTEAMKAISEHQIKVIQSCPDSLQEMSAALLIEAGKRINEELVSKVSEYLAISRHGLRREDLEVLLGDKWNALDFAHYITYMNESFTLRDDGRFDFSHKCIREGFLTLCSESKVLHKTLLDYLKNLPEEDAVKKQEIVYHCIQADDKDYFLDYIENASESDERIEFAAKDAFLHSMIDGGDWICNVMLCKKKSVGFCKFVYNSFLNGTQKQLIISKKILESNLAYAEENKDDFGLLTLSIACNQYAYVCGELGGKENLALSLEYYGKSIIYDELAEKENVSIDFRESKAVVYSNYAYTLTLFAGIENYNKAIEYYQKAIGCRESLYKENEKDYICAINLASSYDSVGSLLSGLESGDNQDKAIVYLEKALELRRAFRLQMNHDLYIDNIISSYCNLAKLHNNRASAITPNDKKKAIEYYSYVLSLLESRKNTFNSTSQFIRLMNVSLSLGNIYLGKETSAKAAENYDRVISIYNDMDPAFITDSMEEDYAYALNGKALNIWMTKDKMQYEKAFEYYVQSIAIIEKLAERYQTTSIQTQLITVYSNCALLCGRLRKQGQIENGIEYCTKALRLVEAIEFSGQLTFDHHKTCSLLYGTLSYLMIKRRKLINASKWLVRSIKSSFGNYKFNINDETTNNVTEEHKAKKEKVKRKDTFIGGVMIQSISVLFAFISLVVAKNLDVQGLLPTFVFSTFVSFICLCIGFFGAIPRISNKGESKKHYIPLTLGIAAIILIILSLLNLF